MHNWTTCGGRSRSSASSSPETRAGRYPGILLDFPAAPKGVAGFLCVHAGRLARSASSRHPFPCAASGSQALRLLRLGLSPITAFAIPAGASYRTVVFPGCPLSRAGLISPPPHDLFGSRPTLAQRHGWSCHRIRIGQAQLVAVALQRQRLKAPEPFGPSRLRECVPFGSGRSHVSCPAIAGNRFMRAGLRASPYVWRSMRFPAERRYR